MSVTNYSRNSLTYPETARNSNRIFHQSNVSALQFLLQVHRSASFSYLGIEPKSFIRPRVRWALQNSRTKLIGYRNTRVHCVQWMDCYLNIYKVRGLLNFSLFCGIWESVVETFENIYQKEKNRIWRWWRCRVSSAEDYAVGGHYRQRR